MDKNTAERIYDFNKLWAENILMEIEEDLHILQDEPENQPRNEENRLRKKRAAIALEVNDALRSASDRLEKFPALKNNLSNSGAVLWKYSFTAPMLITEKAGKWLFDHKDTPHPGRMNATKNGLKGPRVNNGTKAILGEHVWRAQSQRNILPAYLRELKNNEDIDETKFPNTAYAITLLTYNIIVCCRADEAPAEASKQKDKGFSRLMTFDSSIRPVKRSLFKGKHGHLAESVHGQPETLDKFKKWIISLDHQMTFSTFWRHLTSDF